MLAQMCEENIEAGNCLILLSLPHNTGDISEMSRQEKASEEASANYPGKAEQALGRH